MGILRLITKRLNEYNNKKNDLPLIELEARTVSDVEATLAVEGAVTNLALGSCFVGLFSGTLGASSSLFGLGVLAGPPVMATLTLLNLPGFLKSCWDLSAFVLNPKKDNQKISWRNKEFWNKVGLLALPIIPSGTAVAGCATAAALGFGATVAFPVAIPLLFTISFAVGTGMDISGCVDAVDAYKQGKGKLSDALLNVAKTSFSGAALLGVGFGLLLPATPALFTALGLGGLAAAVTATCPPLFISIAVGVAMVAVIGMVTCGLIQNRNKIAAFFSNTFKDVQELCHEIGIAKDGYKQVTEPQPSDTNSAKPESGNGNTQQGQMAALLLDSNASTPGQTGLHQRNQGNPPVFDASTSITEPFDPAQTSSFNTYK